MKIQTNELKLKQKKVKRYNPLPCSYLLIITSRAGGELKDQLIDKTRNARSSLGGEGGQKSQLLQRGKTFAIKPEGTKKQREKENKTSKETKM